jgi:hypothetical protein
MSAKVLPASASPRKRALLALAVWNHPRVWIACSILFGIFGPILCFSVARMLGMFGRHSLALEAFVAISALSMAIRLLAGGRSTTLDGLVNGAFGAATLFALPFSIYFGLIGIAFVAFGIAWLNPETIVFGMLGVQPILTCVVYGVTGVRASLSTKSLRRRLPTIGFLAAIAPPIAIEVWVGQAAASVEQDVLESNRPLTELGLERWRWIAPGDDWVELSDAYYSSEFEHLDATASGSMADRERRIRQAFEELTGRGLAAQFD